MLQTSGQRSGSLRALRVGASKALLACQMPGLALKAVETLDVGAATDEELLQLLRQASLESGEPQKAEDYSVRYWRQKALTSVEATASSEYDLPTLFESVAELESLGKVLPRKAGSALVAISQRIDIYEAIIEACATVRSRYPASVVLTYFEAASLARLERFAEANAVTHKAMTTSERAGGADRSDAFAKILRMIDAISRDLMAWSAKQQADKADKEPVTADSDAPATRALDVEIMLQARMQDAYLAACRQKFDKAETIKGKVAAIKAMMRQGLRRVPTYHDAYEAARTAFVDIGEQRLEEYALEVEQGQYSEEPMLGSTRQLIEIQKLAAELGFKQKAEFIERVLARILVSKKHIEIACVVADALVRIDAKKHTAQTTQVVEALPLAKKDFQIRSLFMWALHSRNFAFAKDYYQRLPAGVKTSTHVYEYVRILQRNSEFGSALNVAVRITETLFINIAKFDPWRAWTLSRRMDEIRFLKDTAHWFAQVPQPAYPKGVIMFAPRNAPQLTKYPLVVLMEMKRRGWAVIPLIEGVMVKERTADPRINKFIGCITPDGDIVEKVAQDFVPIDDLVADLPKGRFAWAGKDLSQVLWEEAAINRRRYHVDYTCPALEPFLERLVNWTRVIGTVLRTAHQDFAAMQLRAGTMVSFQARLPDVMVRFYCEERGNADSFFCLHATNGYENYFANFSRTYSMKAGLRNMTANPELRTASFPIPTRFNQWYDERSACINDNLERVKSVEKVRRVARDTVAPPEGAMDLKAELLRWKEEGGRVACLFGKVVCDMAAPTDGGPAHRNMKDWLNHAIDSVRDSRTILIIKPHPHELRAEIATFLTEKLEDLIEVPLSDNVKIIPADWFDVDDIAEIVDLGVIYNGTTAIELGRASVPAVLCSNFAPIG